MNKIKALSIIISLLFTANINAQDTKELKQQLQRTSNKTEQISILHKLADIASTEGKPAEAISYHKQAQQISIEIGNKSKEIKSLNYIGAIYWRSNNYDSAQYYYQLALDACTENNTEDKARILNNLALTNQSQGNYAEAEKYYREALRNWQIINNKAEGCIS